VTRYLEDLAIGMTARLTKTITMEDIVKFSEVSTDVNPVHLDPDYAATTPFKGIIAHGMLSAGLISAVMANQLPGPGTVYLGQSLKFKVPVRPGEEVTATATIKEIDARRKRVVLDTVCTVQGRTVIEGEATVMFPARPV
jgi:3-hydroxybutyryl-CoA dehydratase